MTRHTDDDLPTGFPREPEDSERPGDALVDLPLGPRGETVSSGAPESPRDEPPPDSPSPSSSRTAPLTRRWLLPLAALGLIALGVAFGLLWPRGTPAVARISESLVDFGRQSVQEEGSPRELVVSNGGTRPLTVASVALTGEAPEDFRLVADGCSGRELDAEGQCTVLVGFRPTGAPGARSAMLEVVGELGDSPVQVPLLGTSVAPVLSLDRHRVSFAPRPVAGRGGGVAGSSTAAPIERLVVTNRGTGPLQLGGLTLEGSASGDFARAADFCTGRTLRPDERCVVELRFEPTAEGARQAVLTVEGRGLPGSQVQLSGTGTAPVARLAVAPEGLDFGERSVGWPSEALALSVTNPAQAPVEIVEVGLAQIPHADTGIGDFGAEETALSVIADTCSATRLQPGVGCALRIAWTPRQEGELSEAVVLRYRPVEDGESGSPGNPEEARIPLTGTAVSARLELEPAELDFGEVPVSSEGRRTVRVVNRGSGPARDLVVEAVGPQAGAFSVVPGAEVTEKGAEGPGAPCPGAVLTPGGDCGFEVRFRPRSPGSHEARVRLGDRGSVGAEASPPSIAVRGTGIAPRLVVRPARLDFGRVVLRETAQRSLVLANEGRAPLSLLGVAPTGKDAEDFRIIGGTCPTGGDGRLGAGQSCRLELELRPREEGSRRARLALRHDAPDGPGEVPLEAVGLPLPKPELTVAPTELRFGDQPVGRRSAIETVRLRNTGDARLDLREVRLDGTDAADFELVPGTCDGLSFLAPGGDCTVGLRFTPAGAGSRRARLLIRHSAERGPTAVALSGLGLEAEVVD